MRWWLRPITSQPSLFSCSSFLCCSSLWFVRGSVLVRTFLFVLLWPHTCWCRPCLCAATVVVLQLSLFWLMRALHQVLLSRLGVCHRLVLYRLFEAFLAPVALFGHVCLEPFSVQLLTCLVGASTVSYLHRCLCDRYGCYRADASAQFCVAP